MGGRWVDRSENLLSIFNEEGIYYMYRLAKRDQGKSIVYGLENKYNLVHMRSQGEKE